MKKRTSAPQQRPIEVPVDVASPSGLLRYAYWVVPFALFLVTRLFSADPYYLLGGDQCTYLELGRTFPKHQLFGHELYLLHPPLFGYAIGVMRLAMPLLAAGLVTTLLFACVNFFAVRELATLDKLPRAAIFAGLTYLALSRPGVAYDYHVARVSMLVAATAVALLAYLRWLRAPSRKTLLWATAANVVCLLVSDQAILLLPCEAILLWARGWKNPAILGAASLAAAAVWPIVRFVEFSRRADLPAGIDGTIEFTKNFPLLAIVQPNFLPFTNAHRSLFTQTSLSLGNLDLGLLLRLPAELVLIPWEITGIVLALLAAAAIARGGSRRRALAWLGASLLFLLPVGLGMNEWYGMGFLVPFTLLAMEGAAACLAYLRVSERAATIGLAAACAAAAAVWITGGATGSPNLLDPRGGRHFLFTRPPLTRAASASHFFDSMPRDTGIMAPQGLSPEIVYLTDKRVVALPFDPQLLDPFIAKYRISYVIVSNEYLQRHNNPAADRYTSRDVTDYIVRQPERFEVAHMQKESYPAFYPEQEFAIFRVK